MYKLTQELPKNQYGIEPCKDDTKATHLLAKYTLDPESNSYSQTGVLCYGEYFDCNEALKHALSEPTPPMPSKSKPTYVIYQLKNLIDTHNIRFISLASLSEQGRKPNISTYDKVYESNLTNFKQVDDDIWRQLEAIDTRFNIDRPEGFEEHSLSVSDVVVVKNKPYYVNTFGFKALKDFKASPEREQKQIEEQEKKPAQKKPKR